MFWHHLEFVLCPTRDGMDIPIFVTHELEIRNRDRNGLGADTKKASAQYPTFSSTTMLWKICCHEPAIFLAASRTSPSRFNSRRASGHYRQASLKGETERARTPIPASVRFDEASGRIVVDFTNGAAFMVPARSIQGLENATVAHWRRSSFSARPASIGKAWTWILRSQG